MMKAINQKKNSMWYERYVAPIFCEATNAKERNSDEYNGQVTDKKVIKFKVGKERKLWNRYYT